MLPTRSRPSSASRAPRPFEIRPHLNYAEAQKYDATADTLEHSARAAAAGPMTRTDALDAGAARKEAYEEAA